MKSIRVFLTEDCNANCKTCLNRSFRNSGKFIDVNKFEKLCDYFQKNQVFGIKIMGGEPTIHPSFPEIMSIAQQYFKRVSLFTNGISDKILDFKPREDDGISYNFQFKNYLTEEKLLLDYPGYRAIEILINKDINPARIIEEVLSIIKSSAYRICAMLTLDCTDGIFKNRSTILPIFEYVYMGLKNRDVNVGIDHSIPVCYVYDTKIPIYKKGSFCDIDCAGLIDSSCNLRYCNQSHGVLLNLFSDDQIVPYKIVENHLKYIYHQQQEAALSKICKDCICYDSICNGGCYISNDLNTRQDILNNTYFPLMK